MAAAEQVVGQLPTNLAAGVRDAVNTAFLDGLFIGSLVCAAIALAAAVVVAALLPARERQLTTAASETEQSKVMEVNQ